MKFPSKSLLFLTGFLSLAPVATSVRAEEDPGLSAAQSAVRNERDVVSSQARRRTEVTTSAQSEKAPDRSPQTRKPARKGSPDN
jgi:hypothetical protein